MLTKAGASIPEIPSQPIQRLRPPPTPPWQKEGCHASHPSKESASLHLPRLFTFRKLLLLILFKVHRITRRQCDGNVVMCLTLRTISCFEIPIAERKHFPWRLQEFCVRFVKKHFPVSATVRIIRLQKINVVAVILFHR